MADGSLDRLVVAGLLAQKRPDRPRVARWLAGPRVPIIGPQAG